jgi:hypothetical protein
MSEISRDDALPSHSATSPDSNFILQPLADELVAIAARLRDVAASPASMQRSERRYLALARQTYALRRKRTAIFGNPELFGEPAWDILLDLYIAQADGKAVSVSSACIGSASPPTTGLRWLGVLAEEGLVMRENDADDNRRVLVRLTRVGVTAMERFLDAIGNFD